MSRVRYRVVHVGVAALKINNILRASCERVPHKTAIIQGTRSLNYEQLFAQTEALVRGFIRLGLGKGDRVDFYLPNCLEVIVLYFACFRHGVTAVPIHCSLRADAVKYIVEHTAPRLFISDRDLLPEAEKSMSEAPGVCDWYVVNQQNDNTAGKPFQNLLVFNTEEPPIAEPDEDDEALILHTSGSTAKHKNSIHTYRALNYIVETYDYIMDHRQHDALLVTLSMLHDASICAQIIPGLKTGSTLILHSDMAFDAEAVLKAIQEYPVASLLQLPSQCRQLAQKADERTAIRHSLRACYVGGDVVDAKLQSAFHDAFGIAVHQCFGMTEIFIASIQDGRDAARRGSVGLPLPGFNTRILSPSGDALGSNEVGELAFSGPAIAKGYLGDEDATRAIFKNGWCITGDLALIDDEGYIWFRGRKKHTIMQDATNISPQDVEEAFYRHPAVLEVCVVGVPDAVYGQAMHACVVLKPDSQPIDAETLLAFVTTILPGDCLPKRVLVRDQLPQTGLGKVDRNKLVEIILGIDE